jgi:hypothetical protein
VEIVAGHDAAGATGLAVALFDTVVRSESGT